MKKTPKSALLTSCETAEASWDQGVSLKSQSLQGRRKSNWHSRGLHSVLLRAKTSGKPVQTLIETIASGSYGRLNEPFPMSKVLQLELLHDFSSSHSIGQVLLVGKDQQNCVLHLWLLQHLVQFILGIIDSVAVRTIHHIDQTICAFKVVAPKSANLVLATHIPNVELDVLVFHGLHIKSYGGDGGNDLCQFQAVQNGGLACSVQTKHQNPHLFGSNHPCPHLAEKHAHGELMATWQPICTTPTEA